MGIEPDKHTQSSTVCIADVVICSQQQVLDVKLTRFILHCNFLRLDVHTSLLTPCRRKSAPARHSSCARLISISFPDLWFRFSARVLVARRKQTPDTRITAEPAPAQTRSMHWRSDTELHQSYSWNTWTWKTYRVGRPVMPFSWYGPLPDAYETSASVTR